MANIQTHQKVSTTLMRNIFFHKLKPGEKLPSERELAKNMDVDRTSLRVALKQLESMELLDIRPGDGIYVKDYLKHAGIDFLRVLFSQSNTPEDELTADMFMLDEVWEWWIIMFPEMVKIAAKRASPRDFKAMSDSMDKEIQCVNDREKLIELWMDQQDIIAAAVNNTVLMLIFNSSRPLRRHMLRIYIENIKQDDMEHFITYKKTLLMNFITKPDQNLDSNVELYREILNAQRQIARGKLLEENTSSDTKWV